MKSELVRNLSTSTPKTRRRKARTVMLKIRALIGLRMPCTSQPIAPVLWGSYVYQEAAKSNGGNFDLVFDGASPLSAT
jgi:hypothetical protein